MTIETWARRIDKKQRVVADLTQGVFFEILQNPSFKDGEYITHKQPQ